MGLDRSLSKSILDGHIKYAMDWQDRENLSDLFSYFSRALRIAFDSLTLGFGAFLVLSNELTVGEMFAATFLMGRLLAPIDSYILSLRDIQSVRAANQRLADCLLFDRSSTPADVLPNGIASGLVVSRLSIELPQRGNVLSVGEIIFTPGRLYLLKGRSGFGKTLFCQALLGICPTTVSGNVVIDGLNVGSLTDIERRGLFGYVSQDIELFDGTIFENITKFGVQDIAEFHRVANLVGIDKIARDLPEGFNYQVAGGRQINLSGGQRQLIAVARALYGDPKYYIFDEPDAHLDSESRGKLIHAIRHLVELGKCVIMVTHRDVTELGNAIILNVETDGSVIVDRPL